MDSDSGEEFEVDEKIKATRETAWKLYLNEKHRFRPSEYSKATSVYPSDLTKSLGVSKQRAGETAAELSALLRKARGNLLNVASIYEQHQMDTDAATRRKEASRIMDRLEHEGDYMSKKRCKETHETTVEQKPMFADLVKSIFGPKF